MHKNLQVREPLFCNSEEKLDVVQIWRTIQGEGPFAGQPAVFVRLAGCNMQCLGCDTNYTDGRHMMSIKDVIAEIIQKRTLDDPKFHADLVVLTGGEPFRQVHVAKLIDALHLLFMDVQVETNGTLAYPSKDVPDNDMLTIVCSPKATKVHSKLLPYIDAYKYVVQAGRTDELDGLPLDALESGNRPARPQRDFPTCEIYLQPMDEGDQHILKMNQQEVVKSCMRFGYRAGIQLHKLLGMD